MTVVKFLTNILMDCSIVSNTSAKFTPTNGCFFVVNSAFILIHSVSQGGGAVFCQNINCNLSIYECSFSQVTCASQKNGGAIFFDCQSGGEFLMKCSTGSKCQTGDSGTNYELGQFILSYVSNSKKNTIEDLSIQQCSISTVGKRAGSIYFGYGDQVSSRINSSYNSVYYHSSIVYLYAKSLVSNYYCSYCCSSQHSICINFCGGLNFSFRFSNVVSNSQQQNLYGILINGGTSGLDTTTTISSCIFVGNHNRLFHRAGGRMNIYNSYIQTSYSSNGASIFSTITVSDPQEFTVMLINCFNMNKEITKNIFSSIIRFKNFFILFNFLFY